MRLNGWQRLWVVISSMWLAIIAAFVYFAWPQPNKLTDFAVTTPNGVNYVLTDVSTPEQSSYEVVVDGSTIKVNGARRPTGAELDKIVATSVKDLPAQSSEEFKIAARHLFEIAPPPDLSRDQFYGLAELAVRASRSTLTSTTLVSTIRALFPSSYGDLSDVQLERAVLAKYPFLKNGGKDVSVSIPGIGRVAFPSSMNGEAINAAAERLVSDDTRRRRRGLSGQALAAWAIPVSVLYAIGWSIAWVRRGFERS